MHFRRVNNRSKNNYMKQFRCKSSYLQIVLLRKGLEMTLYFNKKIIPSKSVLCIDNKANVKANYGTV